MKVKDLPVWLQEIIQHKLEQRTNRETVNRLMQGNIEELTALMDK